MDYYCFAICKWSVSQLLNILLNIPIFLEDFNTDMNRKLVNNMDKSKQNDETDHKDAEEKGKVWFTLTVERLIL